MTALLLLALSAQAEPSALRTPTQQGFTAVIGTPELSVGRWMGPSWGVFGSARLDLGSGEIGAAWRHRLAGDDLGWNLDLSVGASAVALLVRPGVALGLAPALVGGLHKEGWAWTGGLVLPAALTLDEARLPVLLETNLGADLGSFWLGVRLATGATSLPGQIPAFAAEAGLSLGWTP